MPHRSLLLRNDYERKINYDWPKYQFGIFLGHYSEIY